MISEVLATVRALLYAGAVIVVAYMVVPLFGHKSVAAGPQISTPSATSEVQSIILAAQSLANIHGQAPMTMQPAVTVIRDAVPQAKGLNDAEIGLILKSLQPKTVQVVSAGSKIVGPSPAPYTAPNAAYQQIFAADYAATTKALAESHIATQVNITQQEVPLSRFSTYIISNGDAGLGFDLLRRGQLNATIAAVEAKSLIRPAVGLNYCLRHTSLCVGPSYEIGRGAGVSASIHF